MLDYPTINDLSGYQSIRHKRRLGKSFRPGPFDVVCARGKDAYEHAGNQRFRALIELHRAEYAAVSNCKYLKSKIVSKVVATVRSASPDGGFVKRGMDGVWFEVGDRAAKEKCGQHFRDRNPNIYSSSTKAKAKVRQMRRMQEYEQEVEAIAKTTAPAATTTTTLLPPLTQPSASLPRLLARSSSPSIVSDSSDSEDELASPTAATSKSQPKVSFEFAPSLHTSTFQTSSFHNTNANTNNQTLPFLQREQSTLEVFGSHKFHPTNLPSEDASLAIRMFQREPALEPYDADESESNDFLDDDMKRDFCEAMGVLF